MKKIINKILSIYFSNKKMIRNKILIIECSYPAGSNTNILYKRLKEKYDVDIIYKEELKKNGTVLEYFRYAKKIDEISRYNYIISTHSFVKYNKNQIYIELWHGIPLKAMGYMEMNSEEYGDQDLSTDYVITSSKLESSLMGACNHIAYNKHKILGTPRNDYLFEKFSKLGTFEFIENYNKVIIYMPTFRQGYSNRIEGKPSSYLFNFNDFNNKEFTSYLKLHNILLIIKYHPLEEKYKKYDNSLEDNIFHLTNEELIKNELDLYEILPYTDLLITDYSSIYFDYLLLDKPMIFTPTDLEEYSNDRGILLEPYDIWTPGAKCINQEILQKEILKSLGDLEYYKKEREIIKDVFHKYQDGNSTERVIDLIENTMTGGEDNI